MPFFDFHQGFIRFKIVYYGPGLSGKTTNLEQLHMQAGGATELVSIETEGDRTIFFDYMPIQLGKIGGIETLFKLYTVPGQVRYNRTRRMVLKDVDGVVFVADSQLDAMDDNVESLRNLERNLADDGIDISDIPVVLQYNKRDLDGVASIGWLQNALNPEGRQWFEASATTGRNVRETLTAIAREVFELAATRHQLTGQAASQSGAEPAAATSEDGEQEPIEIGEIHDDDELELAPVPTVSKARETFRGAVAGTPSTPSAPHVKPWEESPAQLAETRPPGRARQPLRSTKKNTPVEPRKPAALSGLTAEQRLVVQIAEMREMIEKLLADRVDRRAIEEILAPLLASTERLTDGIERNRLSIDDLSNRLDRLESRIESHHPAGSPTRPPPEVGTEMDDFLKDYLDDFESRTRG